MSKHNVLDLPPVGIEAAAIGFERAVNHDGWGSGVVSLSVINGRVYSLTHHSGLITDKKFFDYFMHDGERWGRRTEFEGK